MTSPELERRLAELETLVERQREQIAALDGDCDGRISRRTLLQGLGVVGLGSYATGVGSADPQGQLGTTTDPLRIIYVQRLDGGLTEGSPLASLVGPGLTVDNEALRAAVVDATTLGDGEPIFADIQGGTLRFRSLEAGNNVRIRERENELTIEASDSNTNNDGANLGSGTRWYSGKSGSDLQFRTLTTQGAITATENTETVSVGGPWADDDGDNLLEPRTGTGYTGIDLTGVGGAKVVTPWVGTTDATALEAFVGGSRAARLGTEGTDRDGNTGAGNVLLGQYATVADDATGVAIGGGGSPTDGHENVVADDYGVVAGGENNQAGTVDSAANSGSHATVGGGWSNVADAENATVAGGSSNTASGYRSTVGGGYYNEATAEYATVSGGGPADISNATKKEDTRNAVVGRYGTIGGGGNNDVFDEYGTIGGGGGNQAGTDDSTDNDLYATVGGGYSNEARGQDSTIGGGSTNTASGEKSTVGGGFSNEATGLQATVPGGENNTANGDHSLAAGRAATADHSGAFVFGDSTSTSITSSGSDEVRSQMPMYAPSFNSTSARAKKTAIEQVRPEVVLDAVRDLDVCTWEFRHTDDGRHMGPMAGDFQDTFGLGDDGTIATVDADGVALAAIQGAADRIQELEQEVADREDRIEELEAERASDAERIDRLESRLADLASTVDELERDA